MPDCLPRWLVAAPFVDTAADGVTLASRTSQRSWPRSLITGPVLFVWVDPLLFELKGG